MFKQYFLLYKDFSFFIEIISFKINIFEEKKEKAK